MILGLIFLFGIVMGLFMIAYDDGVPFALFKRLRCFTGFHRIKTKIGKVRKNLYYCKWCRKPRKHPPLKLVDGGNKMGNNKYNF